MIERKIVIALIVSTEFIREIRPMWDNRLLESAVARRLAHWCIEFFDKYGTAPGRNIEAIFYDRLKADKIPQDVAEEIEEDILPELSEEYEAGINLKYTVTQAKKYFRERSLEVHQAKIEELLKDGQVDEAEKVAMEYRNRIKETADDIDLSDKSALARVRHAFSVASIPVVTFPGALGEMWNEHFIRGGFIALLAPEKRGKTFWLMDIAIRAARQKARVAFFQAGDMTEDQQLRRLCINLAEKSDKEKYCGQILIPVKDCIHNQLDTCSRDIRQNAYGLFSPAETTQFGTNLRKGISLDILKEKMEECPSYEPCYNCVEFERNHWGTPYIQKVNVGNPLTEDQAVNEIEKFFIQRGRKFKISTHANGTLSPDEMNAILDGWERRDGFVPDLIVLDYADLCVGNNSKDYRHGVDMVWKALRAMSQQRNSLVLTATQADAKSYDQDRLKLGNFSEDKRKYSHVTGMYGLNQDASGREKDLMIMRINELMVREGESSNNREVTVLSSLKTGRPFLTSYW